MLLVALETFKLFLGVLFFLIGSIALIYMIMALILFTAWAIGIWLK